MSNFYGVYPVALGVGTGVTSLNGLMGALTLVAGTGISITPAGSNITITNTGGTGTVTSVAMTVPTFLSVAGSPITTSGTLAVSLSGTALPVANGGTGVTSLGNLTDAGTDGIVVTGGTGAVITSVSLAQHVADTTHNGYLSSTDWNTFNSKQASGNYITALTGDGSASGPGSVAFTLATVNGNVGSFTNAAITVNGKGLITAASSGTTGNLTDAGTDGIVVTGGTGAVLGSGTSLAQHVADTTHNGYLSSTDWNTFNGKQASGNYITALTGDATASGPGSVALTLATVNTNTGSFGSSTAIPSFTVNGKGLITAASTNVVIAPAGTLTGTTLASNVVTSSLTTVGTIGTGVWQGTVIGTTFGGTGQNSTAIFPTSGVVVTEAATETLTNKTVSTNSKFAVDLLFSGTTNANVGRIDWVQAGGVTGQSIIATASGTFTVPNGALGIVAVVNSTTGRGGFYLFFNPVGCFLLSDTSTIVAGNGTYFSQNSGNSGTVNVTFNGSTTVTVQNNTVATGSFQMFLLRIG